MSGESAEGERGVGGVGGVMFCVCGVLGCGLSLSGDVFQPVRPFFQAVIHSLI